MTLCNLGTFCPLGRPEGKWREYPPLPYHRDIEKLLAEVEKNENGAFWG